MKTELHIEVNGQTEYTIDVQKGTVNNVPFALDMIEEKTGSFHVIRENKSYTIEITEADYKAKKLIVQVNGNKYTVEAKDYYDELLHRLGMDSHSSHQVNDIKAPMPGLVLDVMVQEGQFIQKGDSVLILEAMKMENILKAPSDGKIKKIIIAKGEKVDKNKVLVQLV